MSNWSPQGNIFALFLFSVYKIDLPDQPITETFSYDDDTKILAQISEQLQFNVIRAIEWSGSNKLNFNFDKFSIFEF